MNKKQEYEQLCRIRNLLFIAAILLAFAAAVVGVIYFGPHEEEPPIETAAETTVETAVETTAEPTGAMGSTEETVEPETSVDGQETEETVIDEPAAQNGETTETCPAEQTDSAEEGTELEELLNGILYQLPENILGRFEDYAYRIVSDGTDSWEETVKARAEEWYNGLVHEESSDALQQQAKANWNAIRGEWDAEGVHSEKAGQLFAFLDAFFSDKEQLEEGGQQA